MNYLTIASFIVLTGATCHAIAAPLLYLECKGIEKTCGETKTSQRCDPPRENIYVLAWDGVTLKDVEGDRFTYQIRCSIDDKNIRCEEESDPSSKLPKMGKHTYIFRASGRIVHRSHIEPPAPTKGADEFVSTFFGFCAPRTEKNRF